MINPATQAFMADRMGAQVRTHRVDHAPQVTQPDTVIGIISEAVECIRMSEHAESQSRWMPEHAGQ